MSAIVWDLSCAFARPPRGTGDMTAELEDITVRTIDSETLATELRGESEVCPLGRLFRLGILAAAIVSCGSAAAQETNGRALSVSIENDALVDTDRYYTNGLRAEYAREGRGAGTLARALATRLLGAKAGDPVLDSMAVGQTIFTPENILTPDPLPDQRPYAGFLFADYTINRESERGADWLLFQVGLVGPEAGGEWAQNWYHRQIIDRPEAQGWDNQLSTEVGFVLAYDRQMKPVRLLDGGHLSADLVSHYGVAAGTLHTDARAGATVRLGSGLELDRGPPRIKPAISGAGYFQRGDGLSGYLFSGLELRAVAHDIFLDGSLFRSSEPSVPSRPLVLDVQAGGLVQYRDTQVSLTFVQRTKEYEGQSNDQRFVALSLSRRF